MARLVNPGVGTVVHVEGDLEELYRKHGWVDADGPAEVEPELEGDTAETEDGEQPAAVEAEPVSDEQPAEVEPEPVKRKPGRPKKSE